MVLEAYAQVCQHDFLDFRYNQTRIGSGIRLLLRPTGQSFSYTSLATLESSSAHDE